jgi:hypothetical protein
MGISDPIMNCILEVCCGSAASETRLAEAMLEAGVCDNKQHAKKCAAWIHEYFDLAPVGTLADFKAQIAKFALSANGAPAKRK